jgi:hypothetical protein
MRTLFIALVAVAALALSGTAAAGGWATVGLGSLPTGVDPDEPWNVELTVLQHGKTPLAGVKPTLTIRNVDTGQKKTFAAKPTDRVGVYAVEVVFPSAGTWAYEVYDGFGQYGGAQTHTFKPVTIGGGSAADGGTPLAWTIGGSSVLLLALLLLVAAPRLRRSTTAPATGLH